MVVFINLQITADDLHITADHQTLILALTLALTLNRSSAVFRQIKHRWSVVMFRWSVVICSGLRCSCRPWEPCTFMLLMVVIRRRCRYSPKWCRTLGRTCSSDCTAVRWYAVCASSNWHHHKHTTSPSLSRLTTIHLLTYLLTYLLRFQSFDTVHWESATASSIILSWWLSTCAFILKLANVSDYSRIER